MILCSLRNLSLSFGQRYIFKDIQFSLTSNDRIGLLGLNGQGKSTLLKILTEEVAPDVTAPPFTFDKSDGFNVFLVPQDLPGQFSLDKCAKDLFFFYNPDLSSTFFELESLNLEIDSGNTADILLKKQKEMLEKFDHLNGWERIRQFESYLHYFGEISDSEPLKNLSGGQVKKIILSIGFSSQAKVVFWDEPTNHLDIRSIELFEDELRNDNRPFILVTHDRYLLGKVTNKIFQIQNAQITQFNGSYEQFLIHIEETEQTRIKTLDKLKNTLKRETEWMRQGIKARGTRSKKRVEGYENLKDKVQLIKSQARQKLELNISQSSKKSKKLIEVRDLTFSYPNSPNLFEDLTLTLYRGDKIGLVGNNGIGKSTLIKILTGDIPIDEQKYYISEGLSIKYFRQNRDDLDLTQTPFQLLGDGTDYVTNSNGERVHVATYFKSFLFNSEQLHRPIDTFSGGERSRLQLALNLRQSADVLIFDEPTNDLDLETINVLEDTLSKYDGTVILISHDRAFLANVTEKTFLLSNKNIERFEGGYDQAQEYIEALELEKSFYNDEETIPESKSEDNENSNKLTYKQKQRIAELKEKAIPELEDKIQKLTEIQNKLSTMAISEDNTIKIIEISQKLEELETHLLELYEEQESLNT